MEENFHINSAYTNESFKKSFLSKFRSDRQVNSQEGEANIIRTPFSAAVLPNFLSASRQVDALEAEARRFPLKRRDNDLFSFNQSDDLKSLSQDNNEGTVVKFPLLRQIRQFFATDFCKWMSEITGVVFDEGVVDSTISLYGPNDYLLCHDDELDRRRIAFIIYLTPDDWDADKEGGCLDLMESDPLPSSTPATDIVHHPWRTSISLPPARNSLSFFEVCAKSFHQVSEVIGTRDRLSVHGWLKSDPLPRPVPCGDPIRIPRISPSFIEEDLVYKWINPLYLNQNHQDAIKKRFKSTSEIQLTSFFSTEPWNNLCQALKSIDSKIWIEEGPIILRKINVLPYTTNSENSDVLYKYLPIECREVERLLRSEAILVILSQLTGITLHPVVESPRNNLCDLSENDEISQETEIKRRRTVSSEPNELTENSEIRSPAQLLTPRFHQWKPGMYTLLADSDSSVQKSTEPPIGDDQVVWRLDLFYHISGYSVPMGFVKEPLDSSTSSDFGGEPLSGGQIIYISRLDNTELLRISPLDNCLSLVYCDWNTSYFVRYINKVDIQNSSKLASSDSRELSSFVAYDISTTYFDPTSNDGDSEEEEEEEEEDDDDDEEEDDDYFGSGSNDEDIGNA